MMPKNKIEIILFSISVEMENLSIAQLRKLCEGKGCPWKSSKYEILIFLGIQPEDIKSRDKRSLSNSEIEVLIS